MKNTIWYIVFFVCIFSCVRKKQSATTERAERVNLNEDKFGFLVFDKEFTEDFFKRYNPLVYNNENLRDAFVDTLLPQTLYNADIKVSKGNSNDVLENSRHPVKNDFGLAKNVLNATIKNGGEKYFSGSLQYLFFYKCLPTPFKQKWVQSTSGDFQFNASFFTLLRIRCKELDSLINGSINYHTSDIKIVFSEYVFNEITAATALKIKMTILNDAVFNDERFAKDKLIFLIFLDNTISQKWRLLLFDWN